MELAPQVAVVERHFDVLVRSLVDARRRRRRRPRPRSRRQHVTLGVITTSGHSGRHGARVIAAAEWTALTCMRRASTVAMFVLSSAYDSSCDPISYQMSALWLVAATAN